MKDTLNRVLSFITFDSPFKKDAISDLFTTTHFNCQQQFPDWSLTATRRKLMAHFWINQAWPHFLFIIFSSILITLPFTNDWFVFPFSVLIAGSFALLILVSTQYVPIFQYDFLPKLETIVNEQQKYLAAEQEIKKCKRTQFSIPTLVIIFDVLTKMSNISSVPVNDPAAELLNNLYGVDKDKIKQNLSRLHKINDLSTRERAEIQKGIDNARMFFEALQSDGAQKILDGLQCKLNSPISK
jgi:hypothetical protein